MWCFATAIKSTNWFIAMWDIPWPIGLNRLVRWSLIFSLACISILVIFGYDDLTDFYLGMTQVSIRFTNRDAKPRAQGVEIFCLKKHIAKAALIVHSVFVQYDHSILVNTNFAMIILISLKLYKE